MLHDEWKARGAPGCPSPFGDRCAVWPLRGLGQSGGCRRPSGSASFQGLDRAAVRSEQRGGPMGAFGRILRMDPPDTFAPLVALRPSGSGNPADAVALRARHPSSVPSAPCPSGASSFGTASLVGLPSEPKVSGRMPSPKGEGQSQGRDGPICPRQLPQPPDLATPCRTFTARRQLSHTHNYNAPPHPCSTVPFRTCKHAIRPPPSPKESRGCSRSTSQASTPRRHKTLPSSPNQRTSRQTLSYPQNDSLGHTRTPSTSFYAERPTEPRSGTYTDTESRHSGRRSPPWRRMSPQNSQPCPSQRSSSASEEGATPESSSPGDPERPRTDSSKRRARRQQDPEPRPRPRAR
jgi:hypothetical protein